MLIFDPIYGYVKITAFIHKYLVVPEFQRLNKIKQLGLCYLLFPDAIHTRLEHSIGVLYVSMRIMDQILLSDPSLITERQYNLICLASIFHDIGHSAFSHLFDSFLETFSEDDEDIPTFFKYKKHEQRSIYLLKKVNSRIRGITKEEETFIEHVILGIPQQDSPKFLYQILSNKTLDSDRIDYITRDGYYTGFHNFNFSTLADGVRVVDDEICYPSSSFQKIEKFISIRQDMYREIYLNQSLFCLNMNVVNKMRQLKKTVFKYDERTNDEHILSFLKLTNSDQTHNVYIEYKPSDIKNIDINEIKFID